MVAAILSIFRIMVVGWPWERNYAWLCTVLLYVYDSKGSKSWTFNPFSHLCPFQPPDALYAFATLQIPH
jgi:hypothetical protein